MLTKFQIRITGLVFWINSHVNFPLDVNIEDREGVPNISLSPTKSMFRYMMSRLGGMFQLWYVSNLIYRLPATYYSSPKGSRLLQMTIHTFWLEAILGCFLIQVPILVRPTEVANFFNRIMHLNFVAGKEFLGVSYASSKFPSTIMKRETSVRKLLSYRFTFTWLAFFPYAATILWPMVAAASLERHYFLYSLIPLMYQNVWTWILCIGFDFVAVFLNACTFGIFTLFQLFWIFTGSFWLEKICESSPEVGSNLKPCAETVSMTMAQRIQFYQILKLLNQQNDSCFSDLSSPIMHGLCIIGGCSCLCVSLRLSGLVEGVSPGILVGFPFIGIFVCMGAIYGSRESSLLYTFSKEFKDSSYSEILLERTLTGSGSSKKQLDISLKQVESMDPIYIRGGSIYSIQKNPMLLVITVITSITINLLIASSVEW